MWLLGQMQVVSFGAGVCCLSVGRTGSGRAQPALPCRGRLVPAMEPGRFAAGCDHDQCIDGNVKSCGNSTLFFKETASVTQSLPPPAFLHTPAPHHGGFTMSRAARPVPRHRGTRLPWGCHCQRFHRIPQGVSCRGVALSVPTCLSLLPVMGFLCISVLMQPA